MMPDAAFIHDGKWYEHSMEINFLSTQLFACTIKQPKETNNSLTANNLATPLWKL